eukprot:CAMPEP_0175067300 /NCGR_PEP_ID=MMETSP0052_2-20121109/17018_1 /TAXON_ID=51329 ORGANISM="Polytomella parva, Strain SAG 63-3" /NCGR_SAMPLE_ID=MMETSP0052_2 /ASSEMBLY_ACC=CAM_ASM_000194 /LENGTH=214 /DNA_ID=CAMNT_0016334159 /DNA_START=106 /DNA_END=750 /DNA_ORIENTATION=+
MSSEKNMSAITLWKNKKEHEEYDKYADLYSIIKTTEKLELAYVRDAISSEQYEESCLKIISQFKSLWASMKSMVPDVQQFMSENGLQCPLATTRLLYSGLPATMEHRTKQNRNSTQDGLAVANTVQSFITFMDSLRLNLVAVDQICPLLMDCLTNMDKVKVLPGDFPPRENLKGWYKRLFLKPATFEIPEEDVRQLLYEMEGALSAFKAVLESQ